MTAPHLLSAAAAWERILTARHPPPEAPRGRGVRAGFYGSER